MPVERNFKAFHESVNAELDAMKNRIRQLIGRAHWQTDGEHKEAILRKVLRTRCAASLEIGRGFVCGEHDTSSQIDILISHRDAPSLFRAGELLLVTPEAVSAIIEVKTRLDGNLHEVCDKLADNAALVRESGNPNCLAGLFSFEALPRLHTHEMLLDAVHSASRGQQSRVLNWISMGRNHFLRYWQHGQSVGSPVHGPVWHSYELTRLSQAYFLSNVAWDTSPRSNPAVQQAWFPIPGGKEPHLQQHLAFDARPAQGPADTQTP